MLLSINPETGETDKRRTLRLQSFGLDERALHKDPISLAGSSFSR
jgi:hypothetical protein